MTALTTRRATASVVAAAAITTGVVAAANPASADSGDPVTGGTTTISQPAAAAFAAASAGVFIVPTTPATASYNEATKNIDYAFPVTGGDGSATAAYGSIKHGGGFIVVNNKTRRSAKLADLTVSFETLTVSVTPAGATGPIDLATTAGSQTLSRDAATGTQTFDATATSLTAAGAAYLDKALATKAFKAGQNIGSFRTVFTNTQY